MNININFDIELSDTDAKQLAAMINVSEADLAKILPDYAKAALEEYIEMINANKNFTRASDMREYRLYLLIKHVFKTSYPTPAEISKLFQTTSSQSASMLNSIMFKFSYELEAINKAVIKALINKAKAMKNDDGDILEYRIEESSKTVIDHVNLTLQNIDGLLPGLKKDTDYLSVYMLPVPSYQALQKYLNPGTSGG